MRKIAINLETEKRNASHSLPVNVLKKPFIHVLSDLKQDHTAHAVSGSPRAVPGQSPGSLGQSRAVSVSN
jgi:hypothetical protein